MSSTKQTNIEIAEGKFWDTNNGVHMQIDEQVSAHIAANRPWQQNIGQTEYRDHVSFSAWPVDGKNAYTNNLDEVAVEDRIKIVTKHQSFFGGMAPENRKDYESNIMKNPTWLDLCLCANDMINCTGDNHHIFLEGVHKTGSFTLDDKSFILLYDFSMGS